MNKKSTVSIDDASNEHADLDAMNNDGQCIHGNNDHISQCISPEDLIPTMSIPDTEENIVRSFDDSVASHVPKPRGSTTTDPTIVVSSNCTRTDITDNTNRTPTVIAVPIFEDEIPRIDVVELHENLDANIENMERTEDIRSTSDIATNTRETFWTKKRTLAVCVVLLLGGIAIVTSFVIVTPKSQMRSNEDILIRFINNVTLSGQTIDITDTSAESQALKWMMTKDPIYVNATLASKILYLNSMLENEISFRIRQRFALLTLWFTQSSAQLWNNSSGWLIDTNECNWYGINCYEASDFSSFETNYSYIVQEINLHGNNVGSTLPADLGLLYLVQFLDFSNNTLTGTLPESIGRLKALTSISTRGNRIVGKLPESIGQWLNLTVFDIRSNSITGTLSESIGQWTSLTQFDISYNFMSGSIPESVGQWTELITFFGSDNLFTGNIPQSIGQWSNIEFAYFFDNRFTGEMPNSICNTSKLRILERDCELPCKCCTNCV